MDKVIYRTFTFLLLTLSLAVSAQAAAPWSGIIDPSRAVDWSNPGPGVTGGIPNRTTQCGSTIAAYNGSPATINNAIAACPSGEYVQLAAGTFTLNNVIQMISNVTLRGMGPDQTIIKFTASGGGNCNTPGPQDVCFGNDGNWSGGPDHTATWTAGYAKGTTTITLSSTAGLSVGQLLILDQQNSFSDNGFLYVCDTTNCSSEGGTPGRSIGGMDANQQEYKRVVSISGNNVTLDSGLYMPNWASAQSPGAWWATTLVQMAGIENLTLDHSASNDATGVGFDNAYNCWMKNVRSIMQVGQGSSGGRNHVWIVNSARITVRDSYFYGTRDASTLSYGVETWQSGDVLVENNIFQHIVSPLLIGNTDGSVFGYNYSLDHYNDNPNFNMPGPVFTHDAGTAMNLFEGNEGTGSVEDNIHGTHNLHTYFRNQWGGFQGGDVGKTGQLQAFSDSSYARMMNIIGNVMGQAGIHNNYQAVAPNGANCDSSIYEIGWQGDCDTSIDTSNVLATLMRWGNYDVVHNAVQWNASEVPSSLAQFANAVPASQVLPSSFYLTAKPPFWGTMPWPAVGPDVTGGNVTAGTGAASTLGGHANMIPARICYGNTPADNNYPVDASGLHVLLFNATACYGTGTPPPTSPTISLSQTTPLNFNGTAGGSSPASQTLSVSNSASNGSTLNWTGSPNQTWLSLSPTTGGNGPTTVTISVNTTGLAAGSYSGTLSFSDPNASNNPQNLTVNLTLTAPLVPALSVTPASLSFAGTVNGTNPTSRPLVIKNVGTGTMNWSATTLGSTWLSLSGNGGSLGTGLSQSINVSVNLAGLVANVYRDTITVTATGATGSPQQIPITLTVSPAGNAVISLDQANLSFSAVSGGANPASQTLNLSNIGSGGTTLNWTATSNATWLVASPTSGALTNTQSASITVYVYTTALSAGSYTGNLTFSGNAANSPQSVVVNLTVTGNSGGGTSLPPIDSDNLPSYAGLNDSLSITNYSDPNVTFNWTFGAATSGNPYGAPAIISRAAGTASFTTAGVGAKTASLASYGLTFGTYQVTVQAQDNSGHTSPTLTATITLVNADFTALRVYPNPWRSDKHAGKSVTFDQLPLGATVKIFTVSGHLVKTITPNIATATWDLTNDSGDKVASGIYVYLITTGNTGYGGNGQKVRGKLAVIK